MICDNLFDFFCNNCKADFELFVSCYVLNDMLKDSCSNCHYDSDENCCNLCDKYNRSAMFWMSVTDCNAEMNTDVFSAKSKKWNVTDKKIVYWILERL